MTSCDCAGEGLAQFVDVFSSLVDEFASDEGEGRGEGGGGGKEGGGGGGREGGGERRIRRGGRGGEGVGGGGGGGGRRRAVETNGDVNGDLPPPREVRAGGKRFYFDVAANDRGTFIKLSEVKVYNDALTHTHTHNVVYMISLSLSLSLFLSQVLRMGRRTHINIPQHCWSKMGEVFGLYAQELPVSEEEEEEEEEGEGGGGEEGETGETQETQEVQ